MYGYKPVKSCYFPKDLLPTSDDYTNPLELREEARERILKAQEQMKRNYDHHCCQAYKYNIGDVVVVRRLPEQTALTSKKTQVKYRGPLSVIKILPSDTYQITDLRTVGQGRRRQQNYTTTAHASQMKLFHLVTEEDVSDDDEIITDEDEMNLIACEPSRAYETTDCYLNDTPANEDIGRKLRPKRSKRLPFYLKDYEL